jgi:hypothetical protein
MAEFLQVLGYVLGPAGLAAIVAAVIALSRRRTERKGEEARLTAEEREGAIKEWKDYAKNVAINLRAEVQHLNLQLTASRSEIEEQRKVEITTRVLIAKQEQVIAHQQELLKQFRDECGELKDVLARAGVRDRSDIHRALPPNDPGG